MLELRCPKREGKGMGGKLFAQKQSIGFLGYAEVTQLGDKAI
jgi:hypothetical protein